MDLKPQWERARRGDREAFARIVEALLPRVRRFLFRLEGFQAEVDDMAQEVFLRLIEGLERAAAARDPEGWVLGIAVNVQREAARRGGRARALPELSGAERSPLEELGGSEVEGRVRAALRDLAPALREVMVLSVFEGLEPRAIGEILGLASGAVRHRLFRARRELEAALAGLLPGACPSASRRMTP